MELIEAGVRWRDVGTKRLDWRDVVVIISQATEDGPLVRAKYPEKALFMPRVMELVLFHLATANVQRGNQSGTARQDFPKPPEWADDNLTRFGVDAQPMEDIAAWLGGDFATMIK